jgi:hypothetical protein
MAIEKVAEVCEPRAAAAPHGSSSDVDERTVFVRSLPFSLSDAQVDCHLSFYLSPLYIVLCFFLLGFFPLCSVLDLRWRPPPPPLYNFI